MVSGMNRRLLLVMAIATGLSVANNYYAQPLLASIAHDFGVGSGAAGLLVTVSQIGYAAGLVALVPLGDLVERRRLICSVLGLSVVVLVVAAAAPNLVVLGIASLAVGLVSVVAQIIVPFAASLADDRERGRVVGAVMSGLLLGILLARTVAGFVGEAFGWRAIYVVAAAAMAALVAVLWRELPEHRESNDASYVALLRSVLDIAREEPMVRRRSFYGACSFATFSVFWTTAAFLLHGAPYHYSDRAIGLFGLLGAAGALAASAAGRLADRGWANRQTAVFLVCAVAAWLALLAGRHHLVALVAGIVVMDLGVQGVHITNQSEIYRLRPGARSRLTTAYMTVYFAGGAAGSLTGAFAYQRWGWPGVCAAGALFPAAALARWAADQLRTPRGSRGPRAPRRAACVR